MTEEICSQGHVLDFGARTCSRCGGQAIGFTQNLPVQKEEVLVETSEEKVLGSAPEKVAKVKKVVKVAKVKKEKVVKTVKKGKKK